VNLETGCDMDSDSRTGLQGFELYATLLREAEGSLGMCNQILERRARPAGPEGGEWCGQGTQRITPHPMPNPISADFSYLTAFYTLRVQETFGGNTPSAWALPIPWLHWKCAFGGRSHSAVQPRVLRPRRQKQVLKFTDWPTCEETRIGIPLNNGKKILVLHACKAGTLLFEQHL
jgi:hypothetical protein